VIANDLSPIQPTSVPPNLKFIIDDFEQPWGYEREPFDYVHVRYLAAVANDWLRLVGQAFNCFKLGGWVEFQDWYVNMYSVDDSLADDSMVQKFHNYSSSRRTKAGYKCAPGPYGGMGQRCRIY
jgi:hypothetical protein